MKLQVYRDGMNKDYTTGKLFVDGSWQCYTLEDAVRRGPKQPGITAIPAGTYSVTLRNSGKFGADWPHVENVPGFTDILIHPGNRTLDTEGCLLVGCDRAGGIITGSRVAMDHLLSKLRAAEGPITIEYINCVAPVVD